MYNITNNNVIIVNVVVLIIIAQRHQNQGLGAQDPHFLQTGILAPHICISYCVANIVTDNFIIRY